MTEIRISRNWKTFLLWDYWKPFITNMSFMKRLEKSWKSSSFGATWDVIDKALHSLLNTGTPSSSRKTDTRWRNSGRNCDIENNPFSNKLSAIKSSKKVPRLLHLRIQPYWWGINSCSWSAFTPVFSNVNQQCAILQFWPIKQSLPSPTTCVYAQSTWNVNNCTQSQSSIDLGKP